MVYLTGIVVILVGPFALWVVNYALMTLFCVITLQQMFDCEKIIFVFGTSDDLDGLNEEDEREENEPLNKLEVLGRTIKRWFFAIKRNDVASVDNAARQRVNIINRGNTDNETRAT